MDIRAIPVQGNGSFVYGKKVKKNQDSTAVLTTYDGKEIIVKTDTIGKYAETKDSLGRKIYEDDIVHATQDWDDAYEDYGDGPVRWSDSEGEFAVDLPQTRETGALSRFDLLVIGNIYTINLAKVKDAEWLKQYKLLKALK